MGTQLAGKESAQVQSKPSFVTLHITSEALPGAWSLLWYLEPHLLQACHCFVMSPQNMSPLQTEVSTLNLGRRFGRWTGRREKLPTGALPPTPDCLIRISLCTREVRQGGRGNDHAVWEAHGRWEVIRGTMENRKLSKPRQYRGGYGCW